MGLCDEGSMFVFINNEIISKGVKNVNKKMFIVICILCINVFFLGGCSQENRPFLYLQLQDDETKKVENVILFKNGRTQKSDVFGIEQFNIYSASSNSFDSYISGNKVLNQLNRIELFDRDGNMIEADAHMKDIFEAAESIEHEIWGFQIIKLEQTYFVSIQLNVNWQSPNDLYIYDTKQRILKHLIRLDGMDVIGISFAK